MIRLPSAAEFAELSFREKRICWERLEALHLQWLETEQS